MGNVLPFTPLHVRRCDATLRALIEQRSKVQMAWDAVIASGAIPSEELAEETYAAMAHATFLITEAAADRQ